MGFMSHYTIRRLNADGPSEDMDHGSKQVTWMFDLRWLLSVVRYVLGKWFRKSRTGD